MLWGRREVHDIFHCAYFFAQSVDFADINLILQHSLFLCWTFSGPAITSSVWCLPLLPCRSMPATWKQKYGARHRSVRCLEMLPMCPGWLRKEKKKKPIHSGNPIISSVSTPPLMSQAPTIFHVTLSFSSFLFLCSSQPKLSSVHTTIIAVISQEITSAEGFPCLQNWHVVLMTPRSHTTPTSPRLYPLTLEGSLKLSKTKNHISLNLNSSQYGSYLFLQHVPFNIFL